MIHFLDLIKNRKTWLQNMFADNLLATKDSKQVPMKYLEGNGKLYVLQNTKIILKVFEVSHHPSNFSQHPLLIILSKNIKKSQPSQV